MKKEEEDECGEQDRKKTTTKHSTQRADALVIIHTYNINSMHLKHTHTQHQPHFAVYEFKRLAQKYSLRRSRSDYNVILFGCVTFDVIFFTPFLVHFFLGSTRCITRRYNIVIVKKQQQTISIHQQMEYGASNFFLIDRTHDHW